MIGAFFVICIAVHFSLVLVVVMVDPDATDPQGVAEEATGSTLTAPDTNNEPFMTKRGNQAALDEKVLSECFVHYHNLDCLKLIVAKSFLDMLNRG